MAKMFDGSTAADYKLSSTGDSIVNATDAISFSVVQDGKTYDSTILQPHAEHRGYGDADVGHHHPEYRSTGANAVPK
jgi:hypothetical protein